MKLTMSQNRLPNYSRGFSLIEIMIVVVIIALVTAGVALSMGESNKQTPLAAEAELLRTEFRFAAEQSVLNSELLALIVEQKNVDAASTAIDTTKHWCYHWVRKLPGADTFNSPWVKVPSDTLEDHCLPEFIQWDVIVEGRHWVYDAHLERQDPILVFAPSGESTPVEMALYESGVQSSGKQKNIEKIEVDMLSNISPFDTEDEDQESAEQNATKKSSSKKK